MKRDFFCIQRVMASRARIPCLVALWALLSLTPVRAAESGPGPDLEISITHPEESSLWDPIDALAIRVELQHPAIANETAPSAPLLLAPAGRAWPEAVSLRVTGPDGKPVSWPLIRLGTGVIEPLQLNLESLPAVLFVLQSDVHRTLPPGSYTLVATLEINDGSGWTGLSESPPLTLEVESTSLPHRDLGVSVAGASMLAVGDPWVVDLQLPPLQITTTETALRSGYRIRVFDSSGREQPWTFEPAVTVPTLPGPRDLLELGLSPVLAVLPPEAATGVQPGTYRVEASWDGGALGPELRGSAEVTVRSAENGGGGSERSRATVEQRLGWATALLWRAEFSSTEEIGRLTRQAAPMLIDAERTALELFVGEPRRADRALAVAETYFLQGNYEGALVFANLALRLWSSQRIAAGTPGDNPPPIPQAESLEGLLFSIQQRAAAAPGRVLPSLRSAISDARPPDLASQWATSALASSEYRATEYSAAQATGAPNVSIHGDNARAWASKAADAGEEWLEVAFAAPVRAEGVRVIQSFNPGAIIRIQLAAETGPFATVWNGPDPTVYPRGEIGVLSVTFAPTAQPVVRVKVVLDTKSVSGWNEIDAVELIAAEISDEPPRLLFGLTPDEQPALEFPLWPEGFVLQHATTLSSPDWTNYAVAPPARFESTAGPAFFRLLSSP